ncbi:hypothetical protein BCR34DRAFT_612954, partial [Clohesyomyces aquaticus]
MSKSYRPSCTGRIWLPHDRCCWHQIRATDFLHPLGITDPLLFLLRALINPPSQEPEASPPSSSTATAIYLPSDDPEVFRDFHHWLYLHELYPSLEPCNAIPLTSEDIMRDFVFGEVHGIPDLYNAAINLLFQKLTQTRAVPLRKELEFACNYTKQGSPLRRFLADDAGSAWPWEIIASDGKEYPEQFLRDVLAVAYKCTISPG